MSNPNPNFPDNLDIRPSTFILAEDSDVCSTLYTPESQQQAIEQYGIAGRVWEAAYILNVYLNPPQNLVFDPPFLDEKGRRDLRIIELGSGSGMVGITFARSLEPTRDLLILTDLPEVCSLLESNVDEAYKDRVSRDTISVRPLIWGNREHAHKIQHDLLTDKDLNESIHLTHILCSDLVYFPELLAPLLRSLIELSSPPFAGLEVKVLISYKIRSLSKETPFWAAFGLWFTFEPVLCCEKKRRDSSSWERFGSALEGPMFIFVAQRRPESQTWNVPSSDEELLAGFGAHGTMQPKADETFETLLFMSMADEE